MERKTRLELATSSLARRHSTTELLPQNGAEDQSRTDDTRIFSPLLYLLSYLGTATTNDIVSVKEKRCQGKLVRLTTLFKDI